MGPDAAVAVVKGAKTDRLAYGRNRLAECLAAQRTYTTGRYITSYNEIIVDSHRAWDKTAMFLAIFIDSRASAKAVAVAREMRAAAAAEGVRLPLLTYDLTSPNGKPFTVLSSE